MGSPASRAPSSVSNSGVGRMPDLGQARQVLAGGVQHPLGVGDRGGELVQVRAADRVDQPGAGALAAQLDQVGPLAVAVARGALGVDGDRSGAGGERGDGAQVAASSATTSGTPSAG